MQGVSVSLDELLALRKEANKLCLPQEKTTNNGIQGQFQSPFRGRGMDFVETRIYQPGDDIRTINWAVTARTGKPHTKIYQQERDRPLYLIVDFSPSMFFGTRKAFKSVVSAKIATLIAWAGLMNGDRIGALLLKDTYEMLPAQHQKQSFIKLLKQLVTFVEPVNMGAVDIHTAFMRLFKTLKSGSLVYFISDFYFLNDQTATLLQQLAKNNQVTNILVYDPLEKALPASGRYWFRHATEAKSTLINAQNSSFCSQFEAIFQERQLQLRKMCYSGGMNYLEVSTADDFTKDLRQLLSRK